MGAVEVYRYERKFVVTETTAEAIRRFVTCYLPHRRAHAPAKGRTGIAFTACISIRRSFASVSAVVARHQESLQVADSLLRRRGDSPAFLEIKKRDDGNDSQAASRGAASGRPKGCWAAGGSARGLAFERRSLGSCPRRVLRSPRTVARRRRGVCVYIREAFVSQTAEGVRVTFDRQIVGQSYRSGCRPGNSRAETPIAAEGGRAGAEVQRPHAAVDARPRDFIPSLERRSFSKYVYCMDALRNVALTGPVFVSGACDYELA